jgi:hypothetical protein
MFTRLGSSMTYLSALLILFPVVAGFGPMDSDDVREPAGVEDKVMVERHP